MTTQPAHPLPPCPLYVVDAQTDLPRTTGLYKRGTAALFGALGHNQRHAAPVGAATLRSRAGGRCGASLSA